MTESTQHEKATQKSATSAPAARQSSEGFTDDERAAMKERGREVKAAARSRRAGTADGEADLLAKIAEMAAPDRALAERVHALIREHAPDLAPRTWYGMPAYAKGADVVCFFQPAQKFKARYATLGFNDGAHLDDGAMWPVAYALTELTPADEATIVALVQKAVS